MRGNKWVRRGVAGLGLTAFGVVGTAGAAWGHECYNQSRSARGDAQAAESAAWVPLSEVFLRFVLPFEIGFEPLTEEQLQEALTLIAAEKASGEFDELYALDRSVLGATVAMQGQGAFGTSKSSDGRAIDHASVVAETGALDPLVEHLIGIYFAVGGSGPAA